MKVVEVFGADLKKNPHGVEVRNLYNTPNAVISHILLKPGEALKKHITPVEVAFFVLEGNGVVKIGEEKREVWANTLIESPANIPHSWKNQSGSDFRVLVIKVPRPGESSKLT